MTTTTTTTTVFIAAGCFWSVQLILDRLPGVLRTEVGYTGGKTPSATYETVCSGHTGHAEAVKVEYSDETTLKDILRHLTLHKDFTAINRQGNDHGSQYRSGVWVTSDAQRAEVEELRDEINEAIAARKFKGPAMGSRWAADIENAGPWFTAEAYHQKYLEHGKGRSGVKQSARKQCNDPVVCYG